jgi:hypothetical protein
MALAGLGVRRLSLSPAQIGRVKAMLRSLDAGAIGHLPEALVGPARSQPDGVTCSPMRTTTMSPCLTAPFVAYDGPGPGVTHLAIRPDFAMQVVALGCAIIA